MDEQNEDEPGRTVRPSLAERWRYRNDIFIKGISDIELEALASVAAAAALHPSGAPADMSAEELDRLHREEERQSQLALRRLRREIDERTSGAFFRGASYAADKASQSAYNTRSIVLLLVVLAVVAMPIIAIVVRLTPQDFGTYIAPVTGIAGTVVGYWFGSGDRPQRRGDGD